MHVASLVISIGGASGQVIQKWKKPDGSLYFGNKPPAGSVKIGETGFPAPTPRPRVFSSDGRESPTPVGGDEFSVKATNSRAKIERTLKDNAARLTELRDRMNEVKNLQPSGSPSHVATQQDVAAVSQFQQRKNEMLKDLEAEQRKRYAAIADAWAAFDDLNERVRSRYGEEPDWWRSTIICGACPTREEAEAARR